MPDRLTHSRDPLPNLRGEDEQELAYLIHLIESLSWPLFSTPNNQPTCLLGRHPHPKHGAFCASLYSFSKNGGKSLDLGPETGPSRKLVLVKLLEVVEMEIGRMMLNDEWHGRKGGKEGVGSGGAGRV
ncbi:hypothetical protein BDW02DRAFT_505328 [Decorospora gaudefroyi]|uniref:Uncharacterized protein n=1 Tax=Decorospora gaudefroyi TaxID=184978 RepID=A0A6A5K1C2_9PLEO|nr:hypothetical protein BDW02DRAFT_505328 [Decorospora gaudefroyi]